MEDLALTLNTRPEANLLSALLARVSFKLYDEEKRQQRVQSADEAAADTRVEFEIAQGPKGLQAENIRPI